MSYSDWAIAPYDGDLDWELINENPSFSNRIDHALVSFDNKLWVLGGYDQGARDHDPYMEDVWASSDGVIWTCITEDAPWKGRRGHEVIIFKDEMYLIGGFAVDEDSGIRNYQNDVWKTIDGENWSEVTAEASWPARFKHQVVQANHGGTDYLYLLTGMGMNEEGYGQYAVVYYNDVWRSTDGETWTEMTSSQDIGQRSTAAAFVNPESNRLYIVGGLYLVIFDDGADSSYDGKPSANWDKMWYTDDGSTWNYTGFGTSTRADNQIEYYEDRFWVLPGRSNSIAHINYNSGPEYYSTYTYNGSSWTKDSESSGVGARYGYAAAVHNNKLWVIGGRTADDGPDNDVWAGELQ
ncbi:MAG: hypothetical protein PQJ61_02390 [Spirochaetales bacterium]|uniref:Galactose oxidase n=1 Tax=Candidatus Thalassospirochaeta sargassi TaxID=3119039 RepID=A0AAJ1ICH6_9SPIO|nr:hypothetical protein [Spirochaetales bacterium]